MKKFLLSMLTLLMSISGAWATVSFDGSKRYYLVEASTGRYAAIGATGAEGFVGVQPVGTVGTPFTLTEVSTGVYTFANADNSEQHLGNLHAWNTTNNATEWTITEAEDIDGTYLLHGSKGYLNYQPAHNQSLYVEGGSDTDTDAKKVHFYIIEDYAPSIPSDKFLSIGEKTNSITASTSASDNDHWYLITNSRIKNGSVTDDPSYNTPVFNNGTGNTVKRAARYINPEALNGGLVFANAQYLVRFISNGEGLYKMQFGDGDFIDSGLNTTAVESQAATYAFYNTVAENPTFGWNKDNNAGAKVDNNGQDANIGFWGEGTVTATSGNNVWTAYPVTFTDDAAISYLFNTTNGAFFRGLANNMAAADGNYCNLWLSKNAMDKPQLKLISNGATTSEGNNMRSSGGLFTTGSSFTYHLSVSEGKIKSYTIVGTAVGALSITPAGGTAESFAADATVNKKVTLDSPAKQTSFTLSGSSQWLNVTKFIVEWETDATIVTAIGDITNDGIYTLEPYNAERGVMYAGTEYLDACGGHANTNYPANKNVAIDASDANQQFVLYTYNGNTYLYNIGRAKFAGVADGLYYKLTNTPTNKWVVSSGSYPNYFHITSQADNKMATLNAWVNTGSADSKDYVIVGGTANEQANNFLLARVGTLTNELQTAIGTIVENYVTLMTNLDKLDEYTIGTGLGEYTNSDFETEAYKEENIASIRAAAANYDATTLAGVKEASATAISNMNINIPATGKFYRIKGYATNKYAKAGNVAATITAATQIPNSVNQESDGSDIWYYDASNHLINYKNGLGTINTHSFATVNNTKETITFQASTCTAAEAKKIGVYEVRSNYNGSQIWYSNTNNVDRNSSNNHVNCEWVLEEVTELPVSISAAGYATYCFPVKVTFNGNGTANAYVATSATASSIHFEEPDAFNAYQGILLKGDEGSYTFTVGGTGNELSDLLSGTTAAVTVASLGVAEGSTLCAFQKSGSDYGFFKYPTAQTTFPGFKAYYIYTPSSGNAGSNFFTLSFDDDDVTAISSAINGQILNGQYYDLQGRKVVAPQKGQLYIHNGKKVLY